MKTIFLMLCTALLCVNLYAQEELKRKDGRTIIIDNDGTWRFKLSISKDSHDGKLYKTVKIGTQTWMVENLNVSRFRNGDQIPEVKTDEEWTEAGKEGNPAWCYYDNNPENGKKYGKLYNWYTVNDKRGLAPKGWHIPTNTELQSLATIVGNDGSALKAINQAGIGSLNPGTNTSGFSALLSGYRETLLMGVHENGLFMRIESETHFLSSTENDSGSAFSINLDNSSNNKIKQCAYQKGCGFSVRCVKN